MTSVGGYRNKQQRDRLIEDYKRNLALQVALNGQYERAVRGQPVASIIAGPSLKHTEEEELADDLLQRDKAIAHLKTFFPKPADALRAFSELREARQLREFNRFAGAFAQEIKGQASLTPHEFIHTWSAYLRKLGQSKTGVFFPVQEAAAEDAAEAMLDDEEDPFGMPYPEPQDFNLAEPLSVSELEELVPEQGVIRSIPEEEVEQPEYFSMTPNEEELVPRPRHHDSERMTPEEGTTPVKDILKMRAKKPLLTPAKSRPTPDIPALRTPKPIKSRQQLLENTLVTSTKEEIDHQFRDMLPAETKTVDLHDYSRELIEVPVDNISTRLKIVYIVNKTYGKPTKFLEWKWREAKKMTGTGIEVERAPQEVLDQYWDHVDSQAEVEAYWERASKQEVDAQFEKYLPEGFDKSRNCSIVVHCPNEVRLERVYYTPIRGYYDPSYRMKIIFIINQLFDQPPTRELWWRGPLKSIGLKGKGVKSVCNQRLGNCYLNLPCLLNNELSLRTDTGNYKRYFSRRFVSDALQEVLLGLLNNRHELHMETLTPEEQQMLMHLLKVCDYVTPYLKRFDILKGELLAGNDNPEIIKEMKDLLPLIKNHVDSDDFSQIMQTLESFSVL